MNSTPLLESLTARGILLSVEGAALFAEPSSELTDDDRAAIRANKPQLAALVALRAAVTARLTDSGHIAVDRELSALWRAAKEMFPGDVVTITGDVIPRKMDAGAAYDPAAAKVEAERLFTSGEITLAQRNGLLAFAEQTALNLTRCDSLSQQKQAA